MRKNRQTDRHGEVNRHIFQLPMQKRQIIRKTYSNKIKHRRFYAMIRKRDKMTKVGEKQEIVI